MLDRGLVTKRHPTMLRPGELQQADDCVYRAFDPAIHAAPARSQYNSTALGDPSPIKGLAFLSFDKNTDLLLSYVKTQLQVSQFTALTGSFTPMLDIVLPNDGTETMNIVLYGNKYYILTSGSQPRRLFYINPPQLSVASCTISSNTITTAATKGFRSVIVGQTVTISGGTGALAAGSRVATKVSDTEITVNPTTGHTNGTGTCVFSSTPFLQGQYAGLRPVTESPTAAVVAGGWSTVSELGAGYYWFIYTEMVIPGSVDDINSGFLESGFEGTMVVAQISTPASQAIQITKTTTVNTTANDSNVATHWQVYMSDKQLDATTKPSLATFKRIGAPIPISTSQFTFSDSSLNQGPAFPTANTTITGVTTFDNPSGAHTLYDGSSATNAEIATMKGNVYQTFGLVSSGAVNGGTLTGSEAVMGIVVKVYGRRAAGNVIFRAPGKVSVEKNFTLGDWSFKELGSSTDTWGESWTPADFVNGTFTLELRAIKFGLAGTAEIDGVSVQVFYTGTSVNRNGIPFRTVTYRSQVGTTVTDSANGLPPTATTGAIFQGSLVLNDVTDPFSIKFSLPDRADSFPKPYFMRFTEARDNTVTNIKAIGQLLVVGLTSAIKRVNYLPTELTTDPLDGLAHEDLATDHGIVGPHASCLVDIPDVGVVMVYVSQKGIHLTDGITTRFLNVDLDWVNTVDPANINKCIVRAYPQENWLVLFYPPAGTSHGKNTRALIFPYSPDKIKEDKTLPAVGPVKVSARSADMAIVNGKTYLLTGHQELGKVYVEDQGLTLPSGYTVANTAGTEEAITIVPTLKTRRVYPAGIGSQARAQRLYIMTDAHGSNVATPTGDTTANSTSITNVSPTTSIAKGQLVTATGLQKESVVTAISGSTVTVSKAALSTATGVTLTFSTGTLGIRVRGQDIGEAVASLETVYQSTLVGGLIVYHSDNLKESFELEMSKVTLPDTTQVGLETALRIHYFAYMMTSKGQETHRS